MALVVLNDPTPDDPGSGDEFYETVASGGNEFEIGDKKIRKDELDTTFRTSLVISW